MQRVVAYRLERHDLATDQARSTTADAIEAVVRRWLRSKGATSPDAEHGTFRSQTHGGRPGQFTWQRAVVGARSWRVVELEEDLHGGQRFGTAISITDTGSTVVVYATLSTGTALSAVAPSAPVDPRCPRVVRDILKQSPNWRHGDTRVEGLMPARGAEMGRVLATRITSAVRTLPIVVVTDDDEGELVLDELDANLAYELAGLANVFRVDHQAAWGLTQALGVAWSCYYGAVRLYWPGFRSSDPLRRHPRWTPDDIDARAGDDGRGSDFLGEIRRLVFRAAAVNIQRPQEIDIIRAAQARAALDHARDQNDFETLAESYAQENERLGLRVSELDAELSELRTKLSALQIDLANAKAIEAHRPPSESSEASGVHAAAAAEAGPERGEIRFYKKVSSSAKRDRMVRVADCGCNNWESANSADKARKGIIALEMRTDWKTMWHCASCTGGGMWKVKW